MTDFISAREVINQAFKKTVRGYDQAQVDAYLEQLAATLQKYAENTKELEQKIIKQAEQLEEYQKLRRVMHEALLNAQKTSDETIERARLEAEKILEEAKSKAASIYDDIDAEKKVYGKELEEIKQIRELFMTEARGMLAKFDSLLCKAAAPTAASLSADKIIAESRQEEELPPAGPEMPSQEAKQAGHMPEAHDGEAEKLYTDGEELLLRIFGNDKNKNDDDEIDEDKELYANWYGTEKEGVKNYKETEIAEPQSNVQQEAEQSQSQLFDASETLEDRAKDRALQYAADENEDK